MRNTAVSSLIPETTGVAFSRESEEMGTFMEKLPFLSLLQHDVQTNPKAIGNKIPCLLLYILMASASLVDCSRARIHAAAGSAAPGQLLLPTCRPRDGAAGPTAPSPPRTGSTLPSLL